MQTPQSIPNPVIIVPYDVKWPARFAAIRTELVGLCQPTPLQIEHIGSTAVPGLVAKPVIDILLGVTALSDIETHIPHLAAAGFEYMPKHEQVMPQRRYFVRREQGIDTCHVHAVRTRGAFWQRHLAFRDALRRDAELAQRYAALKQQLAATLGHDRPAYTAAKTGLIEAVLAGLNCPPPGQTGHFS